MTVLTKARQQTLFRFTCKSVTCPSKKSLTPIMTSPSDPSDHSFFCVSLPRPPLSMWPPHYLVRSTNREAPQHTPLLHDLPTSSRVQISPDFCTFSGFYTMQFNVCSDVSEERDVSTFRVTEFGSGVSSSTWTKFSHHEDWASTFFQNIETNTLHGKVKKCKKVKFILLQAKKVHRMNMGKSLRFLKSRR